MGQGSAFGRSWRPKDEYAARYWGKPREIKSKKMKNGDIYLVKIGKDGRAEKERQLTDHNRPDQHSNPHDHLIGWKENGQPDPGPPINYPEGAPEFIQYQMEGKDMTKQLEENSRYPEPDWQFHTIGDFKGAVNQHSEIEFSWKGKLYVIVYPEGKIHFVEAYKENYQIFDTATQLLEADVDGERLGDIITKVKVEWRSV